LESLWPNTSDGYLFRNSEVNIYNDTGTVDIGYHYDVVNAVFEGNNIQLTTGINNPFQIRAGSTMSYYGAEAQNDAELIVGSSGYLKAQGSAESPILFTSTHMTGDSFNAYTVPANYHYENAIHFDETASRESRIEFCEFNRAQQAILIDSTAATPFELDYPIANCVFEKNYNGVYIYNTCNRIDILNSLFVGSSNAGVYTRYAPQVNNQKSFLNLEGNTFSRNINGLRLDNNQQSTAELRVVVEDNIFSSNDIAVDTPESGFDATRVYDMTRNNIFWNNATDIERSALYVSGLANQMDTNPLFVHHTRAGSGETVLDYDLPGPEDGYYLSQCPGDYVPLRGDASRRAFRLENLSQANPDGISNVSDISGLYYIFVGASEGVPIDVYPWPSSEKYKGKYECPGGGGIFTPGTQSESGPTWVLVWTEEFAVFGSNPRFKMTTTRGTIWVYLPPGVVMEEPGQAIALFLAEDGSTFWGNSSHDRTGVHYFNQDAYYSLRWDTTHPGGRYQPARSAYDAAGASPALDAGSRDFLNNGYTSTNFQEADLSNPGDEDRDNRSYDPENPDQITDPSLYTRLDIGFHYFGSLRHPRERIPAISLYLPLEQGEQPAWYTPAFKVETGHRVAIASGSYNSGNEFPDTTIATFCANYARSGPDRWYPFFLFHQFRSQNNNGMIDGPYQPFGTYHFPMIDRIAMTASTENDNPAGVIYAACTVNWYDSLAAANENRGQTQLNVYRYNNNGTWTLIGQLTITDPGAAPACLEVALAVRNQSARQDLWVFWTEGFIGYEGYIYGARIEDAAMRAGEQALAGVPLRPLIMAYDQLQALDADWDRNWWQYPSGNPRIIWSQDTQYDCYGVYESWVWLESDGDPWYLPWIQPVAVDVDGIIAYSYPSIAVNQRFQINQHRAFAAFERSQPPGPGVWARTNTMNMNGAWGQQVEFNAPTDQSARRHPDVAYRFFETRRICFRRDVMHHDLFTNTERVNPDGPAINGEFPRIATNRTNLVDQFLVFASQWTQSVDSKIDLFHIDP
jgi:hypothetical protein